MLVCFEGRVIRKHIFGCAGVCTAVCIRLIIQGFFSVYAWTMACDTELREVDNNLSEAVVSYCALFIVYSSS